MVGAFTVAGFWWPAGVAATHRQYANHSGSATRPYPYFLLADLAVFAVMVGPVTAVALTKVRRRLPTVALVTGAALVAVLVSDVSGFMRGEVERIWLPYGIWVVPACACLPARRRWLSVQLAVAVAVQALIASPW